MIQPGHRARARARLLAIALWTTTATVVIASPSTGHAIADARIVPDSAFIQVLPAPTQPAPSGPRATPSPKPSIRAAQPDVPRRVVPASTPRPTPQQPVHAMSTAHPVNGKSGARSSSGRQVRGTASWYCNANSRRAIRSKCMAVHPDTRGFDAYAAIGPRLRVLMGGGVSVNAPDPWRNKIVTVCGRRCIRVKLADWCQCNTDPTHPKLLDLYYDVYALTGSAVTVRW